MSKNRYLQQQQAKQQPAAAEEPVTELKEPVQVATTETEPVTQEAVVEETSPVVAQEKPAAVEETDPPKAAVPINNEDKQVRRLVNKIEMELTNYKEAMDPKRAIDAQEGGRWQYSLLQQIKGILNNTSQESFSAEWNTLLAFFHRERDGIFNEKFVFRFPQYWPGSDSEFALFRRVVYLIILTADPHTRAKKAREANLAIVTETLSEDARGRLVNFYG